MRDKGRVLLMTPNLKGIEGGVNRVQPSLGFLLMGKMIRDNYGHEVKIHDTALKGWENRTPVGNKKDFVMIGQSRDQIKEVISDFEPDVVGVSTLYSNLVDSAHEIADVAKEVNPRTVVVMGGNYTSNSVADAVYGSQNPDSGISPEIPDLENPNVDIVMRGEVDFAFPDMVDRILRGRDISDVGGLVMRREDYEKGLESRLGARGGRFQPRGLQMFDPNALQRFHLNPMPDRIDMTALPIPARDLINMEGYFQIGAFHSAKSRSKRVANIMASRGCPEKCTFCTTPDTWGAQVRWRDVDHIVREIKEAKERYNIGEIQFDDDTITARKINLLELCEGLSEVGLPWCTPNGTKTNYHMAKQPELYRAMADSGCYQITLACESGVQRVLDDVIRKNLKVEEMQPAVDNAKAAGLLVHTFWILGYPGETREEIDETVRVALSLGADSYSFAMLNPLPGTPVYRQVVRDNLWWPGRGKNDMLLRNSLVRVDGFDNPEDFERFVEETNVSANRRLKETDPERFAYKYGKNADERVLYKQT